MKMDSDIKKKSLRMSDPIFGTLFAQVRRKRVLHFSGKEQIGQTRRRNRE